jgi:hypothetical protein
VRRCWAWAWVAQWRQRHWASSLARASGSEGAGGLCSSGSKRAAQVVPQLCSTFASSSGCDARAVCQRCGV